MFSWHVDMPRQADKPPMTQGKYGMGYIHDERAAVPLEYNPA